MTIDASYNAVLDNIEEVETAQGKVRITDKKIIFHHLDKNDPLNTTKADFSVGIKMTAIKRVFEMKSEREFEVRDIPEMFGNWVYLSEDASMKDMHEAIVVCINSCIEGIKKQYGQPIKA